MIYNLSEQLLDLIFLTWW